MEKIPAAHAMEWSIELGKGLRSKCPDTRIKAIKQMGSILQALSTEPNITKAVADMYNLVPGEDRTFVNTILLRLSNTFKCGDNYTRRCIVKVFLSELVHIRKEGKRYNGILAKSRVPNYVELLKRVKVVYDTGDTEAKTLALRLFGCWAVLAKDSSHIRYIVLLSLQSCNVPQVKASLFASGCFSMLSEDFACITLQILLNVVCSSQLSYDVTITAIRTFPRLHCSLCGLQLLSGIIRRTSIGAELFIFDANTSNKSEISVLQGSQMALNICIQLKNLSKFPCLQVTKMYCLLAARPSEQLSTDRKEYCFSAGKIDEMVQLNNMLLMIVKVYAGKTDKMSFKDTSVDDWMTACLPFHMNKKGQGFSSCLLDVSAFPVGTYQIKWHSCCTDENGSYWSLLPMTTGALFTVKKP